MDARNELFVYLGSSLATIVGLFTVQLWYESYIDVAMVHAQHRDAPLDAQLEVVRGEEQTKLSSGKLPIEQAISGLAQRGRAGFPRIAPKPSEDLSAMSGWIHKPGFAPYEPRKPVAPVAAEGTAVPAEGSAAEGTAPAEGEAVPAPAEGAVHGAAAPAAAAPAPVVAAPTPAPAAAPAVAPVVPAAPAAEAGSPAAARARMAGQRAPIDVTRAGRVPPARTPSPNPVR